MVKPAVADKIHGELICGICFRVFVVRLFDLDYVCGGSAFFERYGTLLNGYARYRVACLRQNLIPLRNGVICLIFRCAVISRRAGIHNLRVEPLVFL